MKLINSVPLAAWMANIDGVLPQLTISQLRNQPGSKFQNLNDNQSAHRNDFRNRAGSDDLGNRALGSEVIVPLNVHKSSASGAHRAFYDMIDNYVSFLRSWHVPTWSYGAHHKGKAFPGYDYTVKNSADTKGWNIILTSGRLHATWEGDEKACIHLARHIPVRDVEGESNVVCSFDAANEYCHRHGGQIFIPDEFYWNFIHNPMCKRTGQDGNRAHANRFGATYSHAEYWVNLQKYAVPNSNSQYQVRTTNNFHFFRQLDTSNRWTGIGADGMRGTSPNHLFAYQNLLTGVNQSFPSDDFKNDALHQLLGTVSYSSTDMQAHANDYIADLSNGKHLNMHYISEQLDVNGLVSAECMMMECRDNQDRPKVQDKPCDLNNVRPLCIISDIFENFQACPEDLKDEDGNRIRHCGENVRPFLVQNVYNYPGFFEASTRAGANENEEKIATEVHFHTWNSGAGGPNHPANPARVLRDLYLDVFNQDIQENVGAQIASMGNIENWTIDGNSFSEDKFFSNEYINSQAVSNNVNLALSSFGNQPLVALYTNCFGVFENNEWRLKVTIADNNANAESTRTIHTVCTLEGYEYDDITQTVQNPPAEVNQHVYRIKENRVDWTNPDKYDELYKNCPCQCPPLPTFTDVNRCTNLANCGNIDVVDADLPTSGVNNLFPIQDGNRVKYCCQEGFYFETDANSNLNYDIDRPCDRCITLECDDLLADGDDGQTKNFWEMEEPANGNRKVWWTEVNRNVNAVGQYNHEQFATIQGRCVPRKCPLSTWTALPAVSANNVLDVNQHSVIADASFSSTHTWTCPNNKCGGGVIDTCARIPNWVEVSEDTCSPYGWRREDLCDSLRCQPKDVTFGRIMSERFNFVFTGTLEDGVTYRIECNVGYEAYIGEIAQRSRYADDVCQIPVQQQNNALVCNRLDVHDITCRPATCPSPPPNGCVTNAPGPNYAQNSVATCACTAGTCGSRTSTCQMNADGFTASWSSPSGVCTGKQCTPVEIGFSTISITTNISNGNAYTHTCIEGYAMYDKTTGAFIGKSGSTSCIIPNVAENCASGDLECCFHTPQPTYECRPITCPDNPCNEALGFNALSQIYNFGDTANCKCRNNLIPSGTGMTDSGCPAVCDERNGVAYWRISADCFCNPPTCKDPCDIPNGKTLVKTTWLSTWSDYIPGRGLQVSHWASYQCNSQYELRFTHNDERVLDPNHCAMQCYLPPSDTCANPLINYHQYSQIAIYDPVSCYCAPRECRPLIDDDLKNDAGLLQHSWIDPTVKTQSHWPVEGFNTVHVECSGEKFPQNRGIGGGNSDTIVCTDYNTWVGPGTCVEPACVDPRLYAESFYAPGLRVKHTCMSLDTFTVGNKTMNFGDNGLVFANTNSAGNKVGYVEPGNSLAENQIYITTHSGANSGIVATVKEGSIASFTCKKGYSPYLNANIAVNGNGRLSGAQTGNGFNCVCEGGIWVCNMHCRCDGYCLE